MGKRIHSSLARSLCALAVALAASGAAAQDTEVADPAALQIHGFVSPGFMLTTRNDYLPHSKEGTFEFTEVGINVTKELTDQLRAGVQLFARDLGRSGNYDVKADWFFLDYRFANWIGLRAGRIKVPFGLYNEVNDIDAARNPILLPQSLYPIQNRDYLLAQTGVELYGYIELAQAGALEYRLYSGTTFVEGEVNPRLPYEFETINIPYVAGGRLLWETPLPGLRAGGSLQWLRLDMDVLFDREVYLPAQMAGALPADFNGLVETELPVTLWVASVEYAAHDLLLAFEYSRWHGEFESSQPLLIPENGSTSERLYGMVAYRVAGWLQPGAYYSLYYPNTRDKNGREAQQHDVSLTLRFDISPFWLVKVEGHFMSGTAMLSADANDGTPPAELKRNWGLFLAKTTAYF